MTNRFPRCPLCGVRCIPYGSGHYHHRCDWEQEYEVVIDEKTNKMEYRKKEGNLKKLVSGQEIGEF